jgi:hypothetical protein
VFKTKFNKKLFYLSDFSNKMAPSMFLFENTEGENTNGEYIIVDSNTTRIFPIEHRRTESVCYYATDALFDVLYLDM